MELYWHDSLEWLYPDQLKENALKTKTPVLDVPRGGIASIVLVVDQVSAETEISIAADTPGCQLFEMVDVCVNINTAEDCFAAMNGKTVSKSAVRLAPYRVYDPLKPCGGTFRGPGAVLVQFPVKRNAKTGEKTITLTVSDGSERKEMSFRYCVHAVTLPEVGKDSIFLTNWTSWANLKRESGAEAFTAKFWRKVAEHAAMMRHARQNMFLVPLTPFLKYENGSFSLDTKNLKKLIQVYTDAGIHWIEGGHLAYRGAGGWTATDFEVLCSKNSVQSVVGNSDLAAICRPLMDFIRKNKLEKRWIQHATDEPIYENATAFRVLTGLIRKYMPGIPLMDAVCQTEHTPGALDIWCPQVQNYQADQAKFEAMRVQGDHLWTYTCCCPGGPYLNRLLDGELTRPLLLGWGCGNYGLEGFLHWGWNYNLSYPDGSRQDPFEETATKHTSGSNYLPPGDTHLVYPGRDGTVWSSCRLEAQREGMEDWELIRQLMKKDPVKCRKIIRTVFRAFNDFTPEPAAIRKARKALLKELTTY